MYEPFSVNLDVQLFQLVSRKVVVGFFNHEQPEPKHSTLHKNIALEMDIFFMQCNSKSKADIFFMAILYLSLPKGPFFVKHIRLQYLALYPF